MTSGGISAFTMDAVADGADVARATIYYQFGSKGELLDALCDSLAIRGGIREVGAALEQREALDALREFIKVFSRFWASDRLFIRRLRGLGAIDPEFERVRVRDERRRKHAGVIVGRLVEEHGQPAPEKADEAADILSMLTSFESFDALAGPTRSPEDVVPVVYRLALASLGLGAA